MSDGPLLRVEGLSKHFRLESGLFGRATGLVRAVDDVPSEPSAIPGISSTRSASRAA